MTPELMGIIALAVALFGTLKWLSDRMDRRFEQMEGRFERIEADLSKLKEGQTRLEGMFEGAFERIPRARTETSEQVAAPGGGR